MKPILTVPSPHWPMMWLDNHNVRLACPGCGQFAMDLLRCDTGGTVKSLACGHCGLHGVAAVQRKFNSVAALIAAKAPPSPQPEAIEA